ncbi:MAG TPA: S8 family serine peptidase [Chloroflexia bacterium]|nr:S8 family serine peptidase [Chloroflexia bacterium]
MIRRPAWSEQFSPGAIKPLVPCRPLDNLDSNWAWGGAAGEGIKVAVIDSGIEASHPAIGGKLRGGVSITEGPDGPIEDPSPHDDHFGHGTACAGIIHELAPGCDLYSVRVLGERLTTRGGVFAAGLRWAIDNGMDVCNLSLGTPKRDFFAVLHELADTAYFKNIMIVTAANNLPIPAYPSVFASVISVASHDAEDPYLFYYNPEPPVEFGAPGINVRVAWRGGTWITATGNSFAAPHIAGLAARILSKHRHLNPAQLKVILRALSANMPRLAEAEQHV